MTKATIAILGGGNMGASLLGGLIANDYPREKLWITDPDTEKRQQLQNQFQVNVSGDNHAAIEQANVIILAVKPQVLAPVALDIADKIQKKQTLVISIAAGVREQSIQKWLGGNASIVRAMPNTPALIGCGATAMYANQYVSAAQHDLAESILRAVSLVVWVEDEKWMDTVTALSGSGPAYFFLVIEALQNAAQELGLPADIARLLTLQTAFGASRMALESEVEADELRKRVTSPGGTTEQAIRILEENQLREIFKMALTAARKRSEELAELLDKEM